MTIDGVSGRTSYLGSSILNIKNQLNTLSEQLSSGKKATTYAGLGVDAGTATGLRAQIASYASYANTATVLNTRINIANLSLQGMSKAGAEVKAAAAGATLTLDNTGQTAGQKTGMASFTQMIALLNTEVGGRFLFSGRATDTPATQPADVILNGTGAQAGLKQVIDERAAADGTTGLGRLAISQPSATSVAVAEDVDGSPFGFKLATLTTTAAGATVTGPAGSPPQMSVDFGTTNPSDGDKVTFTFNLPDGSSEAITLTASSATPLPAGSFAIGATPADTAANLNAALNTAVGTLANTALVAASAVAASDNFFGQPPLRVGTSPFASATMLVAGTPADTVFWYTGESGSDPARGTAVVAIDQAITVRYGARADEEAFVNQLKAIAAYAAVTTNAGNPNANGQLTALNSRVVDALAKHPGTQSIEDVQADFAGVQAAIKTATTRQAQTGAVAQSMLDTIQGVNDDEIAVKLMALQTSLQASYQTTSSLYQMSLLKFL